MTIQMQPLYAYESAHGIRLNVPYITLNTPFECFIAMDGDKEKMSCGLRTPDMATNIRPIDICAKLSDQGMGHIGWTGNEKHFKCSTNHVDAARVPGVGMYKLVAWAFDCDGNCGVDAVSIDIEIKDAPPPTEPVPTKTPKPVNPTTPPLPINQVHTEPLPETPPSQKNNDTQASLDILKSLYKHQTIPEPHIATVEISEPEHVARSTTETTQVTYITVIPTHTPTPSPVPTPIAYGVDLKSQYVDKDTMAWVYTQYYVRAQLQTATFFVTSHPLTLLLQNIIYNFYREAGW